MTERLSYEEHTRTLAGKLRSGIYALKANKHLPNIAKKNIYFACIHSHISYAGILLGTAPPSCTKQIATIQKKNTGEMKVRLSEAELRGNITNDKFMVMNVSDTVFGLSKIYWIIGGIAAGSLIFSVILFCICKNRCTNFGLDQANPQSTTFIQNNGYIKSQNKEDDLP